MMMVLVMMLISNMMKVMMTMLNGDCSEFAAPK